MIRLKRILLLLAFTFITSYNLFAQCVAGEIEIFLTTGGGTFDNELWVSVTTGANATGSVLWAQGNGTIGNSAGALTNQSICAVEGTTYYVNTYDEWGDSWNGATFTITAGFSAIATSAGSPDDGDNVGGNGGWDGLAGEFESSEVFVASAVSDVCEDDPLLSLVNSSTYDATSGKSGIAIILVTDAWASEITFNLYDNSGGLSGGGVYVYYYAADAIEVFNDDANANGVEYITPGTGGFPAFYTASTNKRTNTLTHDGATFTGNIPVPSLYEYVSMGTWSGTGVADAATTTKTYFGGFAGLARTITVPTGAGTFDPSTPAVGANTTQTYTYNSVYGSAGPASCNTATITNYEVDVHARPIITPVANQPCNGGTYDVTVDVDLGTYNVSVDEDGITAFTVTGSGGTLSTPTLTGTGTSQVTISNIPSGSGWSINVNDVSGISCGLTGTGGNCASVLPIKLVSFWGESKENYNQLNWITATEINNDYFVIEKSDDGVNFEEIEGRITGAGNSSQQLAYEKIDVNPFSQTYYRLKQVDFNGEYSYSNTIVLKNNGKLIVENLHLFPNPAANNLTLNFQASEEVLANVYVTNSLGQRVYKNVFEAKKGINNLRLNIEGFPSGIYFVNIHLNNKSFSERLIKM